MEVNNAMSKTRNSKVLNNEWALRNKTRTPVAKK